MINQLSRNELVHVMDLATRCLFAGTREELAVIISGLFEIVSLQKAVLCKLSPTDYPISIEESINHSYGTEWAKVYTREKFELVDPILHHCTVASGAFAWRKVLVPVTDIASARFLDAAQEFGVVNGTSFVCGFGTKLGPRTLLLIAGIEQNVLRLKRLLAILTVFGPHMHEAYKRILGHPEDLANPVELTPRELEVLNWKQHGKTYWEIGCILGISQRTVKYHFARIETRLNVVSASHAVAKALRLGLIS